MLYIITFALKLVARCFTQTSVIEEGNMKCSSSTLPDWAFSRVAFYRIFGLKSHKDVLKRFFVAVTLLAVKVRIRLYFDKFRIELVSKWRLIYVSKSTQWCSSKSLMPTNVVILRIIESLALFSVTKAWKFISKYQNYLIVF